MKTLRLILFLSLMSFQFVLAEQPTLSKFEIKEAKDGLLVSVKLTARPGETRKLRIPTEGVFFSVDSPHSLVESDLFGSELALDVNGDGDLNDTLKLRLKDGHALIEDVRVEPFTSTNGWQRTGSAAVYQLSSDAPKFILYQTRPKLVVGADYAGVQAAFKDYDAPFLQVILIENCDSPSGRPSLTLEGAEHTVFAFEPGLVDPTPQWHRVQWMVVTPNQLTRFKLAGQGNGALVLAVNQSVQDGVRKRDILAVRPIILPLGEY
jgi:hypothetical protein